MWNLGRVDQLEGDAVNVGKLGVGKHDLLFREVVLKASADQRKSFFPGDPTVLWNGIRVTTIFVDDCRDRFDRGEVLEVKTQLLDEPFRPAWCIPWMR